MSTSQLGLVAQLAQDAAREQDGTFGVQAQSEPEVALVQRPFDIYEYVTWVGDELAVYDADTLDRLTRDRMSASTSKAIQDCPAKWASERSMPRRYDPWGSAEQGTAVHAVLERLYSLPAEQRTKENRERLLDAESRTTIADDAHRKPERVAQIRKAWRSEVRFKMSGMAKIENAADVQVFATELQIDDVNVNGVPFIGYIDRVDGTEGALKPVDHKTGKMPVLKHGDPHGDQLRLYAEALAVKYGTSPSEASVFYTKFGKERAVDLSPEAVADTLDRFKQSWEDLQDFNDKGLYPAKPSKMCAYCPVKHACPAGNREGFANPVPEISDAGDMNRDDGFRPD